MKLFDDLKELGVNVSDGINRLGGNEALYKKLLGTFVKTIRGYDIKPDFDEENYNDVIEKAHAVKGIAGNLSITPIYEGYTQIVSLLRSAEPARAKDVLRNVLPIQEEIIDCIEKHLN